jgi:alkane 1-monooxygenase
MYEREKKYLFIYAVPAGAIISFMAPGWWSFLLPIVAFILIPIMELFSEQSKVNLNEEQEKEALEDKFYDKLLYSMVPLQFFIVFFGLYIMKTEEWTTIELIGKIASMGTCCGIIGINLGHELGHRTDIKEQIMAKALLLSSLYMHFFIEHNRGHHLRAATAEDPATARRGEILYFFWVRSIIFSLISAWELEAQRFKKDGKSIFTLKNEMIQMILIQISFVGFIFLVLGGQSAVFFMIAALLGALLLETVNYIEHYGLLRKKKENGKYEKVLPIHSWNSEHSLGRQFLFELSRHSDHHYLANRKFQVLRYFDESPQMPLGYPGMIVLSTVPPLWFFVMHRHIDKYEKALANLDGEKLNFA